MFALENWSALSENAPQDDGGKPLSFLNVGTGIDLSIRELAEQVAAAVDSKAQFTGTTANQMAPQRNNWMSAASVQWVGGRVSS